MSNLVDTFGDSGDIDGPRGARLITRAAHLYPPVALGALATMTVNDAVSGALLPEWAWWLTLAVCLVAFLINAWHAEFVRLCVRCIQEVPADASRQAARKRPLLWLNHHSLLVVLGAAGMGLALRLAFGVPLGPSWVFLPGDVLVSAYVISVWTHHRLRPWCLFCRRWDDGHGPHERTPVPDPTGVKNG